MAPRITVAFKKAVYLPEWTSFCTIHDIEFRPQIEGQNVYGYGAIEIKVNEKGSILKELGIPLTNTAVPPNSFTSLTVTSPNLVGIKRATTIGMALVKHFETIGAFVEEYTEEFNEVFKPEGVFVWDQSETVPDSVSRASAMNLMNMIRNDLANTIGNYIDVPITPETSEEIKAHVAKYVQQLEQRHAIEADSKVETNLHHETWKDLYPKFWQRTLLRMYLKFGGRREYHDKTPTWMQLKLGYHFNTAIDSDSTKLSAAVDVENSRCLSSLVGGWETSDVSEFVTDMVRNQFDEANPLSVYYSTSVKTPQTTLKADIYFRPTVAANMINLNVTVHRSEEATS